MENLLEPACREGQACFSSTDPLERHRELETENALLKARVASLVAENQELTNTCSGLEVQHATLLTTYAATHRLLEATTSRESVLEAIDEVLVNLVGVEGYAIFELDSAAGELRRIRSEGVDDCTSEIISLDEGPLGIVATTGIPHWAPARAPTEPICCLALSVANVVTGVIAIYRLLPQKKRLETHDHETLTMFSNQAAMALYCVSYTSTRPTLRPAKIVELITALRPPAGHDEGGPAREP